MLATINDKKLATDDGNGEVAYYEADVVTANDYYPFGMIMPGRKYAFDDTYRYGFNGKENDNEVKGEGGQQDYGMRIYDPRLGKFLSVDPIGYEYPWNSSYAFAENEPITNIDLDGLEKYKVTVRTFLPYTYVTEPTAKYMIDKANTRWYPQYKNVEAHGGYKSEQQFEIDFDAGKYTYLSPFVPTTYSKNLMTGEVMADENAGLGDEQTKIGYSSMINMARIEAVISTKNPAMPGWFPTPSIDYNLTIDVHKRGMWGIRGTWDGFPALEIFLEDMKTGKVDLLYFDNTSDAGTDLLKGKNPEEINNLFDIVGDVEINKIGKIGESPHVDKAEPSPKVKKNNELFSTPIDKKNATNSSNQP
ncbi:MAG: hypothetical protein BGO54_07570 [Sphingobacteriales bacterium 46-32]|nr:MAG: hypothetical protein BGO54_07570 [Sphingobacteriales bacterium 46-32]